MDERSSCKYMGSFLGMEEKEGSNMFVKRYFRFNHKKGLLLYYLDNPKNLSPADAKPAGFFNLQFVSMVSDASKVKPTVPHCFSITIQGKKHYFQTSSEKEQLSWITLLRDTAKIRVSGDAAPSPCDSSVSGDHTHTQQCMPCDCSDLDSSGDESRTFVAAYHSQSKPVKIGYCVKQGAKRKNWKKRYFILNQESLSYFSSSDDKYPLRSVDISRIQEVRVSTSGHSQRENLFEIVTESRTFYIQAESKQEMWEWIACVNQCLERKDTLYSPSEFNKVNMRHSTRTDTRPPAQLHGQPHNQPHNQLHGQPAGEDKAGIPSFPSSKSS